MRSQSRLLIEYPTFYQQLLSDQGVDPDILTSINGQKSSINLHYLENPAIDVGLQGESGTVRCATKNFMVKRCYLPLHQ